MATATRTGYWLFKQEPTCYSYADLERDGQTTWDGVTNAVALNNLRKVQVGDRVLFYHTGKEKAVVGEMVVVGAPRASEFEGRPSVVVDVKPVRRIEPVSLARIKAEPDLQDWELVRISRLSVMPVSEAQWQRVQQLSEESPAATKAQRR